MDENRRTFLTGAVGLALVGLASPARGREKEQVFTPEMFGAKGDGITNDSAAFAALAERVNANGGGAVKFRRRTYLVGAQVQAGDSGRDYAFLPASLLHFSKCSKPLTIDGNGATIKCAPGLRFGTFDPITGKPTTHAMPFLGRKELASPYHYMIMAEGCTGPVTIADIELDGSLAELQIGGPYGDTGWQIAASGIYLLDNRGDEIVRNVHSHHHPQDGLIINGLDDEGLAVRMTRRIEKVRCEYNGRQGCSIVGGRGYAFRGCKFNHTGKAGLASAPGAGVDIEAEGEKTNRALTFIDCEFVNNEGCGLVADSGDSADASFTRCRFIGATSWSAWPNKPRFLFRDCSFVGPIVQAHIAASEADAIQFHRCTFTDDPAQSPTGKVYLPSGTFGAIADLNEYGNPIFTDCSFTVAHGAQLPWSIKAVYRDCRMLQVSEREGYPRGIYRGHNTITGKVNLYGSRFEGTLILNGKPFPPV